MLTLENATVKDVPLILQLIRELAEYEKAADQAVAQEEDLRRDGFSDPPKFRVIIARWNGEPAGFALYLYHYSTWLGRPTLYLEDLFVRPQFRRLGIGRSMLTHLAKIALAEGCGRFEWQVLDWNRSAIDFYESLGATVMKEWLTLRLTGQALVALAGEPDHPATDGDPGHAR